MRQLAESKDSLQFTNHLCEQLELKVDELESSNEQLAKLCRKRHALLEQKRCSLADVEEDLASARDECDHVRADLDQLRRYSGEDGRESGKRAHTAAACDSDGVENKEMVELRGEVEALSLKVQSSDFQKRRLEREMASALGENATLRRNLEKAEAELAELQIRFVELTESRSQDGAPVTPHSITSPNYMTPISPNHPSFTFPRQSSSGGDTSSVELGRSTTVVTELPRHAGIENGQSLFSELDTQYNTVLQSYGKLLHKCTCSASLGHKAQEGVDVGPPSNGLVAGEKGEGHREGGAFKELFEEMFATLRQTAAVADRLIERRSTHKPAHSQQD